MNGVVENSILRSIAESIVPFEREKAVQLNIVNKINMLLHRRSQFKPSKTKISGSIGKHTTIVSSDVDLIVFLLVNKKQGNLDSEELDLLLTKALNEFADVLSNYNMLYPIKDICITKYSLKFTVRNIKFDLLPAIDFVGNEEDPRKQQQMTLDVMLPNLPKYVYRFSSSLAFATVDFMKKQSSLAYEMARLAKFWFKGACIDQYVSGANYCMELIAVFVVNQMTTNKHCDAFCKFLIQIINFERIDIVFIEEYRELDGHLPSEIKKLPRVIDPCNPYNNLGKHFVPHVIAALKVHAQNTLQNLQQLVSIPRLDLFHCIDLFDPVLLKGVKVFKVSPKYNERGIRRLKDVEIRPRVKSGERKKIEFIQLCFSAVVNKLEERYGPNDLELVIEALVKIITKQLKTVTLIARNNYAHEDFDASCWLKTKRSGAIRFSFDYDYSRVENESDEYVEKKTAKRQIYLRKTAKQLGAINTSQVCLCTFVL